MRFVLGRAAWITRVEEFARPVLEMFHLSSTWRSIHVDIQDREKNPDAQRRTIYKVAVRDDADVGDLPVGWRDEDRSIDRGGSSRVAEEEHTTEKNDKEWGFHHKDGRHVDRPGNGGNAHGEPPGAEPEFEHVPAPPWDEVGPINLLELWRVLVPCSGPGGIRGHRVPLGSRRPAGTADGPIILQSERLYPIKAAILPGLVAESA